MKKLNILLCISSTLCAQDILLHEENIRKPLSRIKSNIDLTHTPETVTKCHQLKIIVETSAPSTHLKRSLEKAQIIDQEMRKKIRDYVRDQYEPYYIQEHRRFIYDYLPDLEVNFWSTRYAREADKHTVCLKWEEISQKEYDHFHKKMESYRLKLSEEYSMHLLELSQEYTEHLLK